MATTEYRIEIRDGSANVLTSGIVATADGPMRAAIKLYSAYARVPGRHWTVGLHQHFTGGNTHHIQFGYRVGDTTQLTQRYVVSIEEVGSSSKRSGIMAMLTAQQVLDAILADNTDSDARRNSCSVDESLQQVAYNVADLADLRARYARGKDILAAYRLVSSGRSMVQDATPLAEYAPLASDIVDMPAGHIATSAAWRYVALVAR